MLPSEERGSEEVPMEDNGGSKFFYFLMGLEIGALIGVIAAPQPGEKTRELIADKAEEGRDYFVRKGHEVRDQAASYVERGKEALTQQREQLTAAIEAGK